MKIKLWTVPTCGVKFFLPLVFVPVLLICISGCVIVPTPSSKSAGVRGSLDQQALKQFVPGKTSFAEVTNRLGEPDAISPDERQIAYRTEKITGMRLSVIPGQDNGPDPVYTDRIYFFDFDDQGLLKSTRLTIKKNLTNKWPNSTGFQETSERYTPLVQAEYSTYLSAGESLWRVHDQCDWLPGETGSKGFRATPRTAIPGRLFITESNLYFYSTAQLANAGPVCKVPFDSITEVRAPCGESGHPVGLVVFNKTSGTNAFVMYQFNYVEPKNSPVAADFEFIRSKIRTSQPE